MRTQLAVVLGLVVAVAAFTAGAQAQPAPAVASPEPGGALERIMQEQMGADDDARASQARVEQIDDETQKLLADYRKAMADTESYEAYAKQLEAQIDSQIEEIAGTEQQLSEIEDTSRAVVPLMQRMLDTLKQFVVLDVPFLLEERSRRVSTLEQMMGRADVTLSEKYRRVLEAYQVEMDYGRTIEAYEGQLGEDAEARTVVFLRVGRVALLYQTLDGHETGYWDANRKSWIVDDHYDHAFKEGVAVAKKSRAPEMLIVPVPAPKEARP